VPTKSLLKGELQKILSKKEITFCGFKNKLLKAFFLRNSNENVIKNHESNQVFEASIKESAQKSGD
jgi:hypothetical protein